MAEKEYIERGALIEEIRGLTTETWGKGLKNGWWSHSVQIKDNFLRLIEKSPAADVVEVRHARWINPQNGNATCSYCRFRQKGIYDDDNEQNFCGVCGAKMDGGKTE